MASSLAIRSTRSSPGDCHVCNKRILKGTAPGFTCCGNCRKWFHGSCVTPRVSVETMRAKGFAWMCGECDDAKKTDDIINNTQVLASDGSCDADIADEVTSLKIRCDKLGKENE
ncbi:Zinc finger, PHD-type, conserved site [Sergentomyia squamirostris]